MATTTSPFFNPAPYAAVAILVFGFVIHRPQLWPPRAAARRTVLPFKAQQPQLPLGMKITKCGTSALWSENPALVSQPPHSTKDK